MTDFDLDDPLGDLLSDGSNDSFFDPKPKKSSNQPEKKSVKDLFGLDKSEAKTEPQKPDLKKPEVKTEPKKVDDWLGLGETKISAPKPSERASPTKSVLKSTKKISFEDDDDVLGNLGLDKKKEEKKINLMESILGKKSEEKPTTSSKTDNFGFSSLEGPREGRRSRQQQSSGILDPLGLLSNETNKPEVKNVDIFSSPAKKIDKPPQTEVVPQTEVLFPVPKQRDLKTKSAPNIGELPNWLGGNEPSIKTHKSETILSTTNQKQEEQIKTQDSQPTTRLSTPAYLDQQNPNQMELKQINPLILQQNNPLISQENNPLISQQKLINSQIEYQNAAITMQQQESQILMAMQLKKYDEGLIELQRKQQEILSKQEQQFNSLLERQFAKQQIMENNLRLQQEKINNHIQMMLSQPMVNVGVGLERNEEVEVVKKNGESEKDNMFEDMLHSVKERSREEMFLVEESYKKQISTLEETMDSLEKRLKSEINVLNEIHQQKYEQIKLDHEKEIERYKNKIEEIIDGHNEELKTLRDNHNRVIEEIKYEYSTMVENIKQTKQTESNLFQNASDYANKLDTSLKLLNTSTKVLIDVQDRVDCDYNILTKAREESLKSKEQEVKMMREALEKSRESAELERSQLLALIRTLEIKIAEQNQNEREERWALQQATAIFSARSKALERESEYNRTSLEREREEIKTLKETLLAEQEKLILQLTEERLALATERKRLETQTKLSQSYDNQKGKVELEAAIQVAKEAAEMTDREREILFRQQAELENLRRSLIDREKKINLKERDLEAKVQLAFRKATEGEKAMEDARNLERNVNNRMKEVQVQLSSLAGREKKLADEKIAMSKERLALHNQMLQVKKCGLCSAGTEFGRILSEKDDENSEVEQDFPQFTTASDPDLLRLRMQYSDDNYNINLRPDLNST